MMRPATRARAAAAVLALAVSACASPSSAPSTDAPTPAEDERRLPGSTSNDIRVTLVQLNDVYEITPVSGGAQGGLARVATLLQRLEAWNPNTLAVIAGDFLSPSALGTARIDGERLAGRQMVAVLNAMGLDYATFGNHEFDLDAEDFRRRLDEAEFGWFTSNVLDGAGRPLQGVSGVEVLRFIGAAGDTLRLGMIGVTRAGGEPDYVSVSDPIDAVRDEVDALGDSVQALVALTHLDFAEDTELAQTVPELDLIMGGHDHENMVLRRGPRLIPITKADANARSVFVHEIRWDPRVQQLDIESRFVPITDETTDEPETAAEAARWVDIAYAGFRAQGFEPDEVVANVTEPLDGLEASVRTRPTMLTELIAEGMLAEVEGADLSILNGGSIRIDDVIPPGPMTQYDVIRALPFGGEVVEVLMGGALLNEVLRQGVDNQGTGGYLHTAGVDWTVIGAPFEVAGAPIDPDATYRVAITDFLITGRETGLGYLTPDHPQLEVVGSHRDVRQALIDALRRRYGGEE
ncbi:MAG: bifunctional metallophosphatase/5'-nucleotidase [Gemmatimonadetes bacterium]|nr:bifunctional metallophosphatase/5'-nucleotidase [Gemmatimonadota bacterium]